MTSSASGSKKRKSEEGESKTHVEVLLLAIRYDPEDPLEGIHYFKVPAAAVTAEQMARLHEKKDKSVWDVRVKPGGKMVTVMGGMGGAKPRPEKESYDPTGFFKLLLDSDEVCKASEGEAVPLGKTGYRFKFSRKFSSDILLDAGEVVTFFAQYDS